jgi:deglycase
MKKILFFIDDLYEDLELWYPKIRLEEAKFKTVIASTSNKEQYVGKHGYPCIADTTVDKIKIEDYAGLIIPGGYSPDKLRRNQTVLNITEKIYKQKKLVAFICHAGWVPISAKIVKGKNVTSVKAIKDDLENAKAIWHDKSVVCDDNLISSRTPKDLPDFLIAILSWLKNEKNYRH